MTFEDHLNGACPCGHWYSEHEKHSEACWVCDCEQFQHEDEDE